MTENVDHKLAIAQKQYEHNYRKHVRTASIFRQEKLLM